MGMITLKYFIVVLTALSLMTFLTAGSAMAQTIDTTIKPLPDFIQDRPIVEQPEFEPEDNINENGENMAAPEIETAPIRSDMSDIPDEYILEASKFGEECRNDHKLPLYFDCRCMGVKYLDARIELGPDASVSAVKNQLGNSCKDATGIAGQMYQECLLDIVNAPTHLDPEEYCTCYSKHFSEMYEEWPRRMRTMDKVKMMSRSKLVCANPVAARRIYGPNSISP